MRDPAEQMTTLERCRFYREQEQQFQSLRNKKRGQRGGTAHVKRVLSMSEIGEQLEEHLISPDTVNPYAVTAARETADMLFVSCDNTPQRAHVACYVGMFAIAAMDGVEPRLTPHEERALRY